MSDSPDTLLYGTGRMAEQFLATAPAALGRLCFISTAGGGTFRGQPILAAAEAIARHASARIVVVSSFRRQILDTLAALGVADDRVQWFIPGEDRLISTAVCRGSCVWPDHARRELRLVVHHVGGRGFGTAFEVPWRFDRDFVHVLYEADADCARGMIAQAPENVHVLPLCLGAEDGTTPFYLTRNLSCSSMLAPAEDFKAYYCETALSGAIDGVDMTGARQDVIYRRELEIVRETELATRSLDSLAAAGDLPSGALPELLSLDTQGSEHAILLGARRTIRAGVLAIVTEFEFQTLYRDQPLFARLLDFADAAGFHFAGFVHIEETSPYRAPIGQRGKGFAAFGDALFLRRIETLDAIEDDPAVRSLKARKLAFIALAFGYTEYALMALDYASRQPGPPDSLADTAYGPFLDRLHRAAREMPQTCLLADRAALVERRRAPRGRAAPAGTPPNPFATILAEHGFQAVAEIVRARHRAGLPYAADDEDGSAS